MPISLKKEIHGEGYKKLWKHLHSKGCLLAIAFVLITAFGLGNSPASQEPVLLWEKEFDDEAVDVIFGEAEMTVEEARALGYKGWNQRKATDTVKVQYPKALVTEKTLKFLDGKGIIKFKRDLKHEAIDPIENERVIKSKNDHYILIFTPLKIVGAPGTDRSISKAKYTVMNDEGNKLWELEGDLAKVRHISNTGETVVGHDFWGGYLLFYNAEGLIKQVDPIEGMDEIGSFSSFSHDGEYFYFIFMGNKFLKKNAELVCYTKKGKELWRKDDLIGLAIQAIEISPDDNYIVVIVASSVCLYDTEGNLRWKNEVEPVDECKITFSPDSKYVGVTSLHNIYFFNAESGEMLWSYQDKVSSRGFRDIAISSEGNCIFVGATTVPNFNIPPGQPLQIHGPRYVYLFDKEGNTVWVKEYEGKIYIRWRQTPQIKISQDGKRVMIGSCKRFIAMRLFD